MLSRSEKFLVVIDNQFRLISDAAEPRLGIVTRTSFSLGAKEELWEIGEKRRVVRVTRVRGRWEGGGEEVEIDDEGKRPTEERVLAEGGNAKESVW